MDAITEARKYRKQKGSLGLEPKIKIAVIGTASIQYFVMMLDYQLHNVGIDADIYEGEYNGITMDVFDNKSDLYMFNPNIVIILTHYTDIKEFPVILANENDISRCAGLYIDYYRNVWEKLSTINNIHILQSNFVVPPEHLLGNLEGSEVYSKTRFYRRINDELINIAPRYVSIIDLELISQYVGKYQWFDYKAYFISKSGFKMDYLPEIASAFTNHILAMSGRTKKCLVLDLDNTLWGGVVGDDGYDGVQLDPNNAIGEAYRYFQSYILSLKKRGVILAVCSKNDEANAKEPFEKNQHMILRLNDIACFMANWDDKVTNIKRIAEALNIGIDSLVFVDDNPAEREIVKKYLPEVQVIDMPTDPALYTIQLDKENPFNWIQFTKEDINRSSTYIENRDREALEAQFNDYDEYLKALIMVGYVGTVTSKEVTRFTQLLNKSNQFNLRTQRYTEDEINNLVNDDNSECMFVNLKDKFSEYGIIACVILKKMDEECFIESWVMSCRVLKRGVENMTFAGIVKKAKQMGCERISAEYIKSNKNAMVAGLCDSLGFECLEGSEDYKRYVYKLNKNFKGDYYIKEDK